MSDSSNTDRGWTICATSAPTAGNPIFQAGALPQLELEPSRISEQRATATASTQVYGSYNRTRWALGTTYTVLPPSVTAAHTGTARSTTYANVSLSSITYSLAWRGQPPPGFFVDGSTGELLIRMPQTVPRQTRTATLLAHTSDAAPAVVHRFVFEMLPSDTANASNGPNGADCVGGSGQRVDDVEFDNQFSCNCTGIQNISLNCDAASPVSASSESSQTGTEIASGVAVGVVLLAALLVCRAKLRARWRDRRPADFEALQAQILADLGLSPVKYPAQSVGALAHAGGAHRPWCECRGGQHAVAQNAPACRYQFGVVSSSCDY